jgi:hypothetical protein
MKRRTYQTNLIDSSGDFQINGINNVIDSGFKSGIIDGNYNRIGGNALVFGDGNLVQDTNFVMGSNNTIIPGVGNSIVIGDGVTALTSNTLYVNNIVIPTGGTFNGTAIESGTTISFTDTYVTGGTYSAGTTVFTNNTGGTFSVTGYSTSGGSGFDTFVTGGTYSSGTAIFTNNTGGTFNVTGFSTGGTGGVEVFVTGGTHNQSTGISTFSNTTGGTFNVNGYSTGYTLTSAAITSALGFTPSATDIYVTGGTYSSGTTTFVNNSGGTFAVTGYPTSGGTTSLWFASNAANPTINPVATGVRAIAIGENAKALQQDMITFGTRAGKDTTNSSRSIMIGVDAGVSANTSDGIFIGQRAGYQSFGAEVGIGYWAGYLTTSSTGSNLIGYQAGFGAQFASNSNFLGFQAGRDSDFCFSSNFIGDGAGLEAYSATSCTFIGDNAGETSFNCDDLIAIGSNAGFNARSANTSNFIGFGAGANTTGATNSNLFGNQAGETFPGNNIGANNIIIGTNISLPNATANAINLGGILFGTGAYSATTGNPSINANTIGKIGVGVVTPTANLDIAASTTAAALMRLRVGSAPTTPNDGDVWLESNTNTGLKIRINGVTKTISLV